METTNNKPLSFGLVPPRANPPTSLTGVSAEMLTLCIGGVRQRMRGSCPSWPLPDQEGLPGGRRNTWASVNAPPPPTQNTNTPAALQVTGQYSCRRDPPLPLLQKPTKRTPLCCVCHTFCASPLRPSRDLTFLLLIPQTDDCPGAPPRLTNSTPRLAPSRPGGDGRIRSRSNGS